MALPRPKILVTGGAGYIGSHTAVALYEAGYLPVLMDNFSRSHPSVENRIAEILGVSIPVQRLDCRDVQGLDNFFIAEGPFAAVIHFAAFKAVGESVAQPALYYDNNIGGMATLLNAMLRHGNPPVVFSSSCTVYGQPEVLPVTENSPLKPANSPYGYTKQVCEQLIQDMALSQAGIRAVVLRYFNPIGAHASGLIGELPVGVPNNLVPFITQSAAGLRAPVTVFGNDYPTRDGTCVRDYIHVCDLAEAHVCAIRLLEGMQANREVRIFNVASGAGHSVLEVIQAMGVVLGKPLEYELGPRRPGDVAAIWADSGADLPGWSAKRDLETALRDAWRWQQHLMSNADPKDAEK